MLKKCIISFVLCLAFFCNIQKVNAAFLGNIEKSNATFDLNVTNTTYDCNTGSLIINDANFTAPNTGGYYSAYLSKIKINETLITGSYQFSSGFLKIKINNKDTINELIKSDQNKLYMSHGAILKNVYPPNGINVVFSTYSNEKTTNLNVIQLIPKITINSFTSNILTVNSNGGEIILTITGDNLDMGLFKVHNLNSSSIYNLTINKKIATTKISVLPNSTTTSRTDVFVLYLNGQKTGKTISLNVLPKVVINKDINSDNSIKNIKPDVKDNNVVDNNIKPDSNDNNISNDKVSNIDNKEPIAPTLTNKKTHSKSNFIPILIIPILLGMFIYVKVKNK